LRDFVRAHPRLDGFVKVLKGQQAIFLQYRVNPVPRYGYGKPPHPMIYDVLNRNRDGYKQILEGLLKYEEWFLKIPLRTSIPQEPCWINRWLPALDSVTLYSFLCQNNPKNYIEVGSGHSTKFAKRAIRDHGLRTKITSVDPNPRVEVDSICDSVIRRPLEDVDLRLFDALDAGDIFYVDGSHYCFMNSDVTVVFLEVLPRLPHGVFVHLHDILLPYDYPPTWGKYYFSEQYLLAMSLLGNPNAFNIILPNFFVSEDNELKQILEPLWSNPQLQPIRSHHGWSFWMETKAIERIQFLTR